MTKARIDIALLGALLLALWGCEDGASGADLLPGPEAGCPTGHQRSGDTCVADPEHVEFDELAERGLGSAANLTTGQIEDIISEDPRYTSLPPDWKSRSHFCLPLQGAESLMQAGERVAKHIEARMQELSYASSVNTMKLFVGHGAAFRHAAHYLGVMEFDQIARLSMYHAQPILLEYLADEGWKHIDGEWKVRGSESYAD